MRGCTDFNTYFHSNSRAEIEMQRAKIGQFCKSHGEWLYTSRLIVAVFDLLGLQKVYNFFYKKPMRLGYRKIYKPRVNYQRLINLNQSARAQFPIWFKIP